MKTEPLIELEGLTCLLSLENAEKERKNESNIQLKIG